MKLCAVVATDMEANHFQNPSVPIVVSGIGAVGAALSTQQAIALHQPDLLIHLGIGGVYPGRGVFPGQAVCASAVTYGDLGAEDGQGFLSLSDLGFSMLGGFYNGLPVWEGSHALATRLDLRSGLFVTVNTTTGSRATLDKMSLRYPDALVEDMESAGVVHGALLREVPTLVVRGISNEVGPRDRETWKIREALNACSKIFSQIVECILP
ncbi:MAG: futalosine hydrolase [Deinococcaceae bacterium]